MQIYMRRCYDPITWAVVGGSALAAGATVKQASQQSKSLKNAAADADARSKQAAKDVADAQAGSATQAQAGLDARRRAQIAGSKSIYTSPLGISGTANLTRKTLLGQ